MNGYDENNNVNNTFPPRDSGTNEHNANSAFPPPDDGMTDEERRQKAMEMFSRLQYYQIKQRSFEKNNPNSTYTDRSPFVNYDKSEKEMKMMLAPWVGVLLAITVAVMLRVHEFGAYLIFIAVGFYGGVFFRQFFIEREEFSESFRKTKRALFLSIALTAVGLLEILKPLFKS